MGMLRLTEIVKRPCNHWTNLSYFCIFSGMDNGVRRGFAKKAILRGDGCEGAA